MRITSQRRLLAGIATVALTAALAGCGAGNETPTDTGTGSEADVDEGLSGTVAGAGASSQEAAQAAWQAGFVEAAPDVTINYDPIGSSGGREQFISGGVAFAGSDAYFDDEELAAATERCGGSDPIEVPAYISPIAVAYTLEGVDDIQLAPETIVGIFEGDITSWDDPAIAEDNPDADLPSTMITPVHRGDGSGTTENFTEYLSAAGGWSAEPSDEWPIQGGEAATGTSGVRDAVAAGDGTIGYLDASQAADLSQASVLVGEEYVAPSPEAASEIITASPQVEGRSDASMAVDIDRETTEAGVYPIVLASYMMACSEYEDAAEAEVVSAFLSYVVSEAGQETAAERAGAAPLSQEVRDEATSIVEQIS